MRGGFSVLIVISVGRAIVDLARSASDSLSIGIGFLFGLRQLRTGAVPEVERAEPCGAMNGMEPFIGSRLGGAMDDGLVRYRCLERLGRRGGEGGGGINQGYLGSSRDEPRLPGGGGHQPRLGGLKWLRLECQELE